MSEQLPAIGVLVSGEGTNLGALIDRVHGREARIAGVVSSNAQAPALQRAAAAGIETAVFQQRGSDAQIADWLAQREVRCVVLAGYMRLVGDELLERFPDAVINVHPSLLPAFPGLHAIEQALDYGVRVFGVTVHLVDGGVDTGAVISQRAIELPGAGDAAAVLAALHPIEHELLCEAVGLAVRGALRRDPANPRRLLIEGYARSDGAKD